MVVAFTLTGEDNTSLVSTDTILRDCIILLSGLSQLGLHPRLHYLGHSTGLQGHQIPLQISNSPPGVESLTTALQGFHT